MTDSDSWRANAENRLLDKLSEHSKHGVSVVIGSSDVTVDDIIGRYGDMRSLVGHVLYLPCGDAVAGGLPGPAGT